jgi:oligosaccharide repeat unit polymerase
MPPLASSSVPPTAILPPAAGGDARRLIGLAFPFSLLFAALCFFVVSLVERSSGDMQCAAALAITAAPFLLAAYEAPGRLLHPLAIFGFTMVLGVAGQTIYLVHGNHLAGSELLSGLSTSILDRGLIIVTLGVFAFLIGFVVSNPGNGTQRPGRLLSKGVRLGLAQTSPRRTYWVALLACLISVVAFALYAPKVGIHSPGQLLTSRKRWVVTEGQVQVFGYYRFLLGLPGIAFLLCVYTITRERLRWWSRLGAVAIISIVLTTAYSTVTSSRTQLFVTLASAVFIWIALRRREPRLTTILFVLAAALSSIVLLGGIRDVEQGQASSLSNVTGGEAMLENAFGSRDWMDIGPLSVVFERVPEAYPFQYGKTLVSILWEPIPRSIWPDKPEVRIGPAIGHSVLGFKSNRISGDPPGILGEFWIDGGVPFVLIGMFVLGNLAKRVERWYRMVAQTDGLSGILYGVLIVAVCLQLPIGDFTGVLTSVISTSILLLLMLFLIRRPPARRSQAYPEATAVSASS